MMAERENLHERTVSYNPVEQDISPNYKLPNRLVVGGTPRRAQPWVICEPLRFREHVRYPLTTVVTASFSAPSRLFSHRVESVLCPLNPRLAHSANSAMS